MPGAQQPHFDVHSMQPNKDQGYLSAAQSAEKRHFDFNCFNPSAQAYPDPMECIGQSKAASQGRSDIRSSLQSPMVPYLGKDATRNETLTLS